jgi:muconolactone delta-isomerase
MKFLVVAKVTETPPVPMEQILEMVVGEWQTALELLKEGKAEVDYPLVGLKGGMAIFEAESASELNATLTRFPLYPFWDDTQIYPLMSADEALAEAKKSLQAFKAQR